MQLAAATPALQYPLRSPTQSRQSDTNGATGVDGTQPEGSELGPRCSAVPMQSLDDAKDHLDHEDGLQCKPSSSRLARQISATVPSLRGVLFSQRSIPEDASVVRALHNVLNRHLYFLSDHAFCLQFRSQGRDPCCQARMIMGQARKYFNQKGMPCIMRGLCGW